jgi:hypothetical protein
MISTYQTARISMLVAVEALTVPNHVKFHVHDRWQGAPESVVEKSQLASRCEVRVINHGARSSRVTHQRSAARHPIFDV